MTNRPERAIRRAVICVLALAALFTASPVSTQSGRAGRRLSTTFVDGREAVAGEVLVRYRNPQAAFERSRAEGEADADDVEMVGRRGLRRMHSRRHGTHALLAMLSANPDVELVEPNYIIRVSTTPNDPSFMNLWGLLNTGQDSGGAGFAGSDIDATLAWDLTTGSRATVVGVVDTGIDYNHPDLAANIWSAPAAFSVTIGGVVISCAAGTHGFNAITNTCNPMDDHNHGTHVSGTIGGVGNNGIGVAGVNWTASLMGLKFLSSGGSGSTSDAIKAIEFAVQAKAVFAGTNGANVRVLSNSWGGGGYSQSLLDEINRANSNDMLFVAAAGNSGTNNDAIPSYPASYSAPNMVAVAATDNRDQRASFSSYGAASVHLGAPGVNVLSTIRGSSYAYFNGTSMATPHVAGAAALLLSACPLTTAELKTALLTTVDPIASMAGVTTTGGRLNVNTAIRSCAVVTNPVPSIAALSPSSVGKGGPEFSITVDGSGFVRASQVRVNGAARATVYVSASRLTATILAGDLAAAGTRAISVVNPAPGGGTSIDTLLTITLSIRLTIDGVAGGVIVGSGAAMTVTVADGPGNPQDWLTVVPLGAPDTFWTGVYQFLNGTTVTPNPGLTDATVTVFAPMELGQYELRFFANGWWTRLATQGVITVVAPNPVPVLTSIAPTSVLAGGPAFLLTVTGGSFLPSSQVRVNGVPRPTNYMSTTSLTAAITASDIATAATRSITVSTPAPGGGTSAAATLTVTTPQPVPVLTAISPAAIPAGGAAFTLTATGSAFTTASQLRINGVARATTFVSSTTLTTAMSAADRAAAGSHVVTVATPAPGGGTSGTVTLSIVPATVTVNGSAGAVSVLANATLTVGVADGPAYPLDRVTIVPVGSAATVIGSTTLYLNGTAVPPAAGMSSATVTMPAPAVTGSYEVRLLANGGTTRAGTSGAITVTVPNPVPTVSGLSPAVAVSGGSAFTLSVSGTGFVPASQVLWNGVVRTTTYMSSTQLNASITAGDIASVGTAAITVSSPAPGGGTSGSRTLTIVAPAPAPILSGVSPASVAVAGPQFTLTVTGANFIPTSVIRINAIPRATTFVSANTLTAVITAAERAAVSTYNVTVATPSPGGGSSGGATLSVLPPTLKLNGVAGGVSVVAGAGMVVDVSNGPANPQDWLTVVPIGAEPMLWTGVYQFLNGTTITPAAGLSDATVIVLAPLAEGQYELRFFANGWWTRLATQGVITVVPGNPAPTLTGNTPAVVAAGGPAFTLTITGAGFVPASQVSWNGSPRSTTYVSPTMLTALIAAADIATAGSRSIAVSNPAPGGGTSAGGGVLVMVPEPAPVLGGISPTSVTSGGAGFILTATGSAFTTASTILINGSPRATTYVSANSLTTLMTAADRATAATYAVSVSTTAVIGGGVSTSAALTVVAPNPAPVLSSVSPPAVSTGSPAITLTVTGSGFVPASRVLVNGTLRTTTYLSATTLTAALPTSDLAVAATYLITVTSPAPGGGTSGGATLSIIDPAPAPVLSTINPVSVTTGGVAFTLTVTGSNFVPASVIRFNGTARATAFVSATTLTTSVSAAERAAATTYTVVVATPAPGGGTTTSAALSVIAPNPVPSVTTLTPASVLAGSGALSVTVSGTGFMPSSEVLVNGAARSTTYVSPTTVTAAILASDVASATTHAITVSSPAPGGGISNSAPFTVTAVPPAPVLTSITPTSVPAGGAAFTLTVSGSSFLPASVIRVNGSARATTFVSSITLTTVMSVADRAAPGSHTITVFTPAPGGGTSATQPLTIVSAGVPALTVNGTAGPVSVTAGTTMTVVVTDGPANPQDWLTVVPRGSAPTLWTGVYQFLNGTTVPPPAGLSNATVAVPAPMVEGQYELRFFANGWWTRLATSGIITVGPSNGGPVVGLLSPARVGAGATGGLLKVSGSAFVAGSRVQVDGVDRATTYYSPTTVLATLLPGDTASIGAHAITVVNTPGGAPSNAATLTVTTPSSLTVNGMTGPMVVSAGETLSVGVTNGPANTGDWVTLVPAGSQTGHWSDIWLFLNGQTVAPQTGMPSATLSFVAPTVPGQYEFRFFADGSWIRLATTAAITVQ